MVSNSVQPGPVLVEGDRMRACKALNHDPFNRHAVCDQSRQGQLAGRRVHVEHDDRILHHARCEELGSVRSHLDAHNSAQRIPVVRSSRPLAGKVCDEAGGLDERQKSCRRIPTETQNRSGFMPHDIQELFGSRLEPEGHRPFQAHQRLPLRFVQVRLHRLDILPPKVGEDSVVGRDASD
eukprot:1595409-Rhodomonas_salina.4